MVTERVYLPKHELESLRRECAILRQCLEEAVPGKPQRESLVQKWTHIISKPLAPSTPPDEEYDEPSYHDDLPTGRVLRYSDNYARFHGGSAGGVFIDQLRTLVAMVLPALKKPIWHQTGEIGSSFASFVGRIHTYDSRPITSEDINPMCLPEVDHIPGLLEAFWGYTEIRNESCGGIYYWGDLDEILSHVRSPSKEGNKKGLCLLNATIALACQFERFRVQSGEQSPGEQFFTRAAHLLGNPLSESTLIDMQALTFMSYYLLGSGRRDTAYTYIGAAMRIAVAHGLHEGRVTSERQKREFWNMFILDR